MPRTLFRITKTVKIFGALILTLIPGMSIASALERGHSSALTGFQLAQLDKKSGKVVSQGIPAQVPGDVISDLMRAGKLKHPYHDFNSKAALWVNGYDWLYQTDFFADLQKDERLWILFRGIDYKSRGLLNGEPVFRHTGMFSPVLVDATGLIKPGQPNRLEVKLLGLGNRPHSKTYLVDSFLNQLKRRTVTKNQMSFGWDISVELINAGIWDHVETFKTGPVLISDLGIKAENDGNVSLELNLDSNQDGPARFRISITPENFGDRKSFLTREFPINLSAGKSEYNFRFQIPHCKLWWCNGFGEPNLYRLNAELVLAGKTSDRVSETFGFREIKWEQNPGAPEGWRWVLVLNGKRIFMRGANWVPPSAMAGEITDERYARLVSMASDANINILRIWGGGGREREIFYDLADRAGIMIWQEFPFACVYIPGYPTGDKFLELAAQETGEIVRATRNHPCLVLYSGGNEFIPDLNRKLVDRMRESVSELAPETRFIKASPAEGDGHNWVVWHQKGNLTDYFSDTHAVISEFGIQSFPAKTTLEKYFSPDLLWPVAEVYRHHNMEYAKIMKYISAVPHEENLDGYIQASQKIQAYYLQLSIEHWRIRKYRVSGTFFWMLNEPWPAVVGSVIDYELKPKPAFGKIRQSYNPLLIAADLEVRAWKAQDDFHAEIFLVNDTDRKFSGLEVQAFISGEKVDEWTIGSEPDSSLKVSQIDLKLPSRTPLTLELFVRDGEKMVSQNSYDLEICDNKPAGRFGRSFEILNKKILEGKEAP